MRSNKKSPLKSDKTQTIRGHKRGVVGYSRKTALLEEAITQMNAGKYGRSSAALKELLALDPVNMEARRLFATLHLRLGSLIPARQAFDSLITEAFQRQDYWLAESLLREYLAAGPRCVPFLEKLGSIYQEKGDALEAVAEYGKAIDILIEDPDPENPHLASQLYAKIRELAPASPVAFRLASCFDAETGELLAPKPGSQGASTTDSLPETIDGAQSGQGRHELKSGAMPWDVQDPPEVVELPSEKASSSEVPPPPEQSANVDVPVQEVRLPDRGIVSPDLSAAEPEESSLSEVQADVTEQSPAIGIASAAAEIHGRAEPRAAENPECAALSVDSTVETPPARMDSGPALSVGDSSVPQEAEPVSAVEFHEASPIEADTASATIQFESVQAPESSIGSLVGAPDANVVLSLQAEAAPAPTALENEPSPPNPLQVPNPELSSSQTATTAAVRPEEFFSKSDESIPAPGPAPERTASWKQSGFSWESVLNSVWKFGDQPAAKDSAVEPVPVPIEEAAVEAPVVPSPHDRLLDNPSIEIPERETPSSSRDDVTSGSPVAPMPWDQVQESAISIPPAEADPPTTENMEQVVDQSPDPVESNSTPIVNESQSQPLPSPSHRAVETDSFSLAQDSPMPLSPEPHSDAVEVEEASLPAREEADHLVETEPPFHVASSPTVDEATIQEEPAVVRDPPARANEPIADTRASQEDVRSQHTDSLLRTEEIRTPALPETAAQSSEAATLARQSQPESQLVEEITHEQIEEVQASQPSPTQPRAIESVFERTEAPFLRQETRETVQEDRLPEVATVETRTPVSEPVSPHEEEWVKTSASIRFIQDPPRVPIAPVSPAISERPEAGRPLSVAAAAVDVLFESSQNIRTTETRERAAESKTTRKTSSLLNRIRVAVSSFIHSCFSTTRAIVTTFFGLVVLSGLCIALGIGAIALTWVIMEEPPSSTFQNFTTTPQRTLFDSKKNAYMLLIGIDASAGQDPLKAGSDGKLDTGDGKTALACFGNPGSPTGDRSNASASVMRGWVRNSDPVGQFRSHQESIKGWSGQHRVALERYSQWQKLPFEDWGYGQPGSLPCAAMAFAHQLYVAHGFVQDTDTGVDRLETDMETWRVVLGQAKTLPVKMLALQAINDDIAMASGLLVRPDFDSKHLGRITKFLRPLDSGELSIRWPMQSELVSASKTYANQLKAVREEEQPVYTTVATVLLLPKQRRLNDYAKYYEASYKVSGERQYSSLPRWKDYLHFPAAGIMDYLTNPIENVVGLEPLPAWDVYNGLTVDTDAHLRLASLQAWLRRGSAESDLLTRIAKAGQGFYDPYTGLPMLVNMKKSVLYSVGHDGKDQDADPQFDVVVEIPVGQSSAAPAKSSAASTKSK